MRDPLPGVGLAEELREFPSKATVPIGEHKNEGWEQARPGWVSAPTLWHTCGPGMGQVRPEQSTEHTSTMRARIECRSVHMRAGDRRGSG